MTAVALEKLTTAELLDELEQRLRQVRNGRDGDSPDHGLHWNFSATGPAPTSAHILRVRMDLAGLTKASFGTAFGVSPEVVESWLSQASPVPPWVLPAIRMYEMLSSAARQKVLRTPASRAGNRSGNTHPFARIEEL
jgi:hypothetical protein